MRVLHWVVGFSSIVGLMTALMVQWARPDRAPRNIVFHGGAIVTMASVGEVDAIWIREGRIERVGDVAEVRAAAGGDADLTRDLMHLAPGHIGPLNYDLDRLTELFSRFHEAGYRLAFHTQGERVIAVVLDAAESVLQAHPWKDDRHRLEHNALITV